MTRDCAFTGWNVVLNIRNNLRAFESVLDVCKLEWRLIDASAENVKAAGFFKSLGGKSFLRSQKMAGCLPNFTLL